MKSLRRAVFLDRDGVIIENRPDHVKCWAEVRFLDGSFETLRRLASAPLAVVIVTNQAAIGRGLVGHDAAKELQRRIVAEIEGNGGRIDASYMCPHVPEDRCQCRKPAPGMLRQAAEELGLDLPASWLVGDNLSDMKAAAAGGLQGMLVRTGRGIEFAAQFTPEMAQQWPVVDDLPAAIDRILTS
jgi:D-glycero-D-manno-heptose 1,7-bisphosphate phosphatase